MDADNSTLPSDDQEVLPSAPPADEQSGAGPSAGALLRAYREEAGLEQETLAAALKVSPQKLQALETDNYDALPAIYFARGLAANICRHLRRDAAPVLAKMPDEKPAMPISKSTDAAMHEPSMSATSMGPGSGGMPKWMFAVAALLVLAAIAVFVVPQLRNRLAAPAAAPASASEPVNTAPVQSPASAATPMTLQPASTPAAKASSSWLNVCVIPHPGSRSDGPHWRENGWRRLISRQRDQSVRAISSFMISLVPP